MPLDITFTLSDQDLEHFQDIVDKAKSAMDSETNAKQIEEAARKLIDDARSAELPEFIAERLSRLEVVINMLSDAEWKLGEDDRKRVISALVYFCDPEDIIPDSVPGLGFLDDAIYVELVLRELKAEISSYEEFCNFRIAEENRRREQGQDTHVNREEWLADKRATLHNRMRRRRRSMGSGGGWRMRW
ncbi:MAG TPA: YkvA family protein [Woeseiaceae bacterium]|nr:YkvA family protein [Woeseiaceae bacterium]